MSEQPNVAARVDHDLCAGVGQCVIESPGAFQFDDDGMSVFEPHDAWTHDELRKAVDFCPMNAISLVDPAS